jgi:hypothetical protein
VFVDAFNLNSFVDDDFTTDGGIRWSYEIAGTPLYSVNGADPLSGNPIDPDDDEQIELVDIDPAQVDNNPYTVTLRDISFSPIGGSEVEPPTEGIVNSQVVTFWASDKTTASSRSTIFYTDNNGIDTFSGGFEPFVDMDFTSSSLGWTYFEALSGDMTGAQGTGGLCVTAVLNDAAIEGFVSDPADAFDLVDNSVYRLRYELTSTATLGATPILQMVANNTAGTTADGFAYGGEFFIVDSEGSANAISNRAEYLWYFTPAQVGVSNWRSATGGAFDPGNAGIKNFRLEMNVFDVDGLGGAADGNTRAGTVCLTNLVIQRGDLTAIGTGDEEFGIRTGDFTATNFGIASGLLAINGSIVGGNLVATGSAGDTGLLNLEPGPSPFAPDTDHFPIAVTADTAYRIQWVVTASAGSSPIEIIRLNADLPTNEIIQNAYAAASGAGLDEAALPTMGGSSEVYTGFFYTHTATTSVALPQNWRPSLTLAQRPDVNGALSPDNTLTFSDVSVVPLN